MALKGGVGASPLLERGFRMLLAYFLCGLLVGARVWAEPAAASTSRRPLRRRACRYPEQALPVSPFGWFRVSSY